MSDVDRLHYRIDMLSNRVKELERLTLELCANLDSLRISTGHTGNQWMTIPPAPKKGEGDGRREGNDGGRGVVAQVHGGG